MKQPHIKMYVHLSVYNVCADTYGVGTFKAQKSLYIHAGSHIYTKTKF